MYLFILFQYEAKDRVSASDAMKFSYFNSLGPEVHKLADSKYSFTKKLYFYFAFLYHQENNLVILIILG